MTGAAESPGGLSTLPLCIQAAAEWVDPHFGECNIDVECVGTNQMSMVDTDN